MQRYPHTPASPATRPSPREPGPVSKAASTLVIAAAALHFAAHPSVALAVGSLVAGLLAIAATGYVGVVGLFKLASTLARVRDRIAAATMGDRTTGAGSAVAE